MNKTKKAIIARNLENWFTIDKILFNEDASKVIASGQDYKQYLFIKASLLSNLYEYWNCIGYNPKKIVIAENTNQMIKMAEASKRNSMKLSAKMLKSESVRKKLAKKIMKEAVSKGFSLSEKISKKLTTEKFLCMSLDNALIALPLLESKKVEDISGFKMDILEEAHRMLRTNLVRIAFKYKRK